jgi:hypothetical protein
VQENIFFDNSLFFLYIFQNFLKSSPGGQHGYQLSNSGKKKYTPV